MKKWLLRILYAALVLLPIGAIADYTATPGSGSTVFAFVCFTTKICPAHVLTNSAGTEIATSGNPVRTDPTGTTTQPVAVASPVQTVGPTAVGSANANPPVVIGGTVTGAAGQNVGGVAVKPASTVALATDQSMVVQESPNSPLITAINAAGSISQATPGTTNGVAIVGVNGATALAGNGQTGTGALRVTASQDSLSAPINISTSTTTQLVALSGSTSIYVTSEDVMAGGTGTFQFVYGTGTNCGTGTTALTGAYPLTAQAGLAKGNGAGTILKVPSGNALCATTVGAVQYSGAVSYLQF